MPRRPMMKITRATREQHGDAILQLLNESILTSTALYEYEPRPASSMDTWFAAKDAGRYPVLAAETADGEFLGFASYGAFRAWPAYKYTVESGVYVQSTHRGMGVGSALMRRLIDVARENDVHVVVAGIDRKNLASIHLHESLGFVESGTIRHAGFKFGKWLDLVFYQRVLDTPTHPVDGNSFT